MLRKLLFLMAVLILVGCAPAALPVQPAPGASPVLVPQPFQLTLLHTNDTWGYLIPCG